MMIIKLPFSSHLQLRLIKSQKLPHSQRKKNLWSQLKKKNLLQRKKRDQIPRKKNQNPRLKRKIPKNKLKLIIKSKKCHKSNNFLHLKIQWVGNKAKDKWIWTWSQIKSKITIWSPTRIFQETRLSFINLSSWLNYTPIWTKCLEIDWFQVILRDHQSKSLNQVIKLAPND